MSNTFKALPEAPKFKPTSSRFRSQYKVVVVLISFGYDGKPVLLLLRDRIHKAWTFLSAKIEKKETPSLCVYRELREELRNTSATISKLFKLTQFVSKWLFGGRPANYTVFVTFIPFDPNLPRKFKEIKATCREEAENSEICWIPLNEFNNCMNEISNTISIKPHEVWSFIRCEVMKLPIVKHFLEHVLTQHPNLLFLERLLEQYNYQNYRLNQLPCCT